MATQAYTNTPKARVISSTATLANDTLVLDGLDKEAVDLLNTIYAASVTGSFASVTITQEAANRGGYGKDGPYYTLKMVFST